MIKKKRKKRTQNNLKTTKLKISIYLSIISLNINGLNDPIKNSNWKRRNKTITVGKKKKKKKQRLVNGLKKTKTKTNKQTKKKQNKPIYMPSTTDPLQI